MSDALREAMTDEEIVERVTASVCWTSAWFKFSNFVVRFLVSAILLPVIFLSLISINFLYVFVASLFYDIIFGNARENRNIDANEFLVSYFFLKRKINYTNKYYNYIYLMGIYILSIYTSDFEKKYVEYFSIIFIYIILLEFIMINKVYTILIWYQKQYYSEKIANSLRAQNTTANYIRFYPKSKYGPSFAHMFVTNKFLYIISLNVSYAIYIYISIMYLLIIENNKYIPINIEVVIGLVVASVFFVGIAAASPIQVRARDAAKRYLSLTDEITQ